MTDGEEEKKLDDDRDAARASFIMHELEILAIKLGDGDPRAAIEGLISTGAAMAVMLAVSASSVIALLARALADYSSPICQADLANHLARCNICAAVVASRNAPAGMELRIEIGEPPKERLQ